MKKLGLALAVVIAAGCDGGTEPTPVKKIAVDDSYARKLRGLSQQNRDIALRRAIQDSGQTCKRIASSAETGTYENMATWTARCEGGAEWGIFIAPTGDAQVRSCAHLRELGLPGCAPAQATGSSSSKS